MKTMQRVLFQPQPGSQTSFLESSAREVFISGQVGSGKSFALLVAPLRYINNANFKALILRKSMVELELSLIPDSRKLYNDLGGKYNAVKHLWTFPSGSFIQFGFIGDTDFERYRSTHYVQVLFDEMTHFSEHDYTYLFSRMRTADNTLSIQTMGCSNPDSPEHWIYKRWGPWLDPDFHIHAEDGEILYVKTKDNIDTFYKTKPEKPYITRQLIFGRTVENKILTDGSPDYIDSLDQLTMVDRLRLKEGKWIGYGKGLLFKRQWFEVVNNVPAGHNTTVRYWDRASSTSDNADYTVGIKMIKQDNYMYVVDMIRIKKRPLDVENTILETAGKDGISCAIWLEQDPGSAGEFEIAQYMKKLIGYNVRKNKVVKDKITRAQPVSAQSEARNIKILKANWNDIFFTELEAFPEGTHDDIVDSFSGAFNSLIINSTIQWHEEISNHSRRINNGIEYSNEEKFMGKDWIDEDDGENFIIKNRGNRRIL